MHYIKSDSENQWAQIPGAELENVLFDNNNPTGTTVKGILLEPPASTAQGSSGVSALDPAMPAASDPKEDRTVDAETAQYAAISGELAASYLARETGTEDETAAHSSTARGSRDPVQRPTGSDVSQTDLGFQLWESYTHSDVQEFMTFLENQKKPGIAWRAVLNAHTTNRSKNDDQRRQGCGGCDTHRGHQGESYGNI